MGKDLPELAVCRNLEDPECQWTPGKPGKKTSGSSTDMPVVLSDDTDVMPDPIVRIPFESTHDYVSSFRVTFHFCFVKLTEIFSLLHFSLLCDLFVKLKKVHMNFITTTV